MWAQREVEQQKKNTVSSKQTHRREEGGLWALPKNYRDKYRLLAEGDRRF